MSEQFSTEYIDKAIEKLNEEPKQSIADDLKAYFTQMLKNADFVQVVRCKDCKYCTEYGDWCQNENVQGMCFTDGLEEHYFGYGRVHFYPDMDFFCKYGERKETE